ncbi:MAG: SulP family inorganic anion transporter [Pseudomonadota bacterium]
MIAILEARRAGLLGRAHLAPNLLAGLVVGVVALPLAMAFAIASGARPEQGLYTAIVAGLCTTLFGGTRLQISGPTGAFVAVLAVITAQHGVAGLQVATLMAGLILLALGAARLGSVIKYIPDPVIVGFTSGIALIIFVGQWQYFFGLAPAAHDAAFHERLVALAGQLPQAHLATAALGLLTLATLVVGTRWLRRVPAPLVAMALATALQAGFAFEGVATIGSAFGGIPRELPRLQLPTVDFGTLTQLIGPAFTIALLGAIESLLSATVADGMAGTRHDSNQELVGQGIANVLAPLFGGFAATGAIARTATNVRNGATGPLAGLVHCGFLVLVIVTLAPLASHVPLAALAAILFYVAWNMAETHRFAHLVRTAPRPDVAVLLITFALTVLTDLVVAVNVGVVLASLLFMRRRAQAVRVETHSHPELAPTEALPPGTAVPADTAVYTIDGPFFFGAAEKLESALRRSQSRVRTVVIRMGRVPFMDTTGLNALDEIVDDFRRNGGRVVLCELRDNVRLKLERAGILAKVGADGTWESLDEYLRARAAA